MALPVTTQAQARGKGKNPKIGFIWHARNVEEEAPYFGAFRQGFTDLGYFDGLNIEIIDTFAAEQMEAYDRYAAALTKLPVGNYSPPSSMRKSQSTQQHDETADFLIRQGIRARSTDVRPQASNVPEEATKMDARLAVRLVSRPQLLSTRQRLDMSVSS